MKISGEPPCTFSAASHHISACQHTAVHNCTFCLFPFCCNAFLKNKHTRRGKNVQVPMICAIFLLNCKSSGPARAFAKLHFFSVSHKNAKAYKHPLVDLKEMFKSSIILHYYDLHCLKPMFVI